MFRIFRYNIIPDIFKNLKQIERNGENVSERVMEFFNRRTVLILNLLLGTFETVITSFESLNSFESHNLF